MIELSSKLEGLNDGTRLSSCFSLSYLELLGTLIYVIYMTMFVLTDGQSESFPAVGKQNSWSS
jgi:hypothetical protein